MTVIINGTTGVTSVNGSAAAPSVTGTDTDTGIVYGTNTLSLATGGTTAVTLDSSQNVLVGTTAPINSEKVAIWTAATVGIKPGLVINNPYGYGSGVGTAGTSLTFARSRVTGEYYPSGQIVSGNESETTSASTYMSFYTTNGVGTNTERARFNSGGTFVLAGGNTSATGVGIAFPATQSASSDANTLDDYEEGTWTPTCPTTLTTAIGAYVKVGSVVFFSIRISVSVNASATGFTLSLPFAASSDDTTRAGAWFSYTNGGSATPANTTWMLQGGGVGTLIAYNINGAGRPCSEFNSAYWIGGQYRTA